MLNPSFIEYYTDFATGFICPKLLIGIYLADKIDDKMTASFIYAVILVVL